ncbi:F-box/FBD/LRR-repeat protein At5g53840 [Linum perenne]
MTETEESFNGDAEGDGSEEADDRISSLSDKILHQILDRVGSHKESAKTAILSKRWNHLWLSYPVLEFNHNDYTNRSPSRSTMNSFIAAARRKLSYYGLNHIKSVRIVSFDSAFIGAIFDLIGNREPEEFHMSLSRESVIPTLLLNSSSSLRTLKLVGCKLLEDQYKMMNLRMIHFSNVNIDHRVLNSVIAGAPLLEKLILMAIKYVKRLEICKHANLKHLQITDLWNDSIQIVVGALQSLESLSLRSLDCHDLEMICSSLLPSLKSLEIEKCYDSTDHLVNKLISESPSLLSLRLVHMDKAKELKIESPTLEKLELEWCHWNPEGVLHIDTPSLVDVHIQGDISPLHAISRATNSFQAAQIRSSTFVLSLSCMAIGNRKFKELKEFLMKVTRQFQFVELQLHYFSEGLYEWYQVEDDSPTPVIERVEIKSYRQWELLDQIFLYKLLWSCHPKYFSLDRDVYTNILPSLEVSLYIHIHCVKSF